LAENILPKSFFDEKYWPKSFIAEKNFDRINIQSGKWSN